MKNKGICFFATVNDMGRGLESLEEKFDYKYVLTGSFENQEIQSFSSYRDIPNFGISKTGNCALNPFYILVESVNDINIRHVPQKRGGVRYLIDGATNQFYLRFQPACTFESRLLNPGVFHPQENEKSINFYGLFSKHFLKNFEVIKSYRVGSEAAAMLDNGIPLCNSIKAGQAYYLRR